MQDGGDILPLQPPTGAATTAQADPQHAAPLAISGDHRSQRNRA